MNIYWSELMQSYLFKDENSFFYFVCNGGSRFNWAGYVVLPEDAEFVCEVLN